MSARSLAFLLGVGLALAAPAAGGEAAADRRFDPRLRLLALPRPAPVRPSAAAGALSDRLRGRAAARRSLDSPSRLPVLVKFTGDPSDLWAAGLRVQSRIGSIFAGMLEPERIDDLARLPGLHHARLSDTLSVPRPPVDGRARRPRARPPSLRVPPLLAPPAPASLDGAGVLVAVIDTGADVFHEDFRKPDGTTRIRYLLDLAEPGDVDGDGDLDGPGPFGGTLYGEADINAALSSGGDGVGRDSTGHGTHVLSIAAGDDAAMPGIAPAADLLVVNATREDGSLGFESADVISALAFVDERAAELGLPYVVNLSLGTLFSSHDGRSLEEQAIDSLVGPGVPGKAVVIAAGNSAEHGTGRHHHVRGRSDVGLSVGHGLVVPSYAPNPGRGDDRVLIDVWHQGRDRNTIRVTGPGCPPVVAAHGRYVDEPTPCGDVFIINLGGADSSNGDVEALVLIDDYSGVPPAAGNWTVALEGEAVEEDGVYDGWLAEASVVGAARPYFSDNADDLYLVGKPGAAYHGITAGSFARHVAGGRFRTSWTDVNGIARVDASAAPEDLSDFSSTGRTRDGRIKPDLAAPGERVLGAVSKDAYPGVSPYSIYRFHPFPEPDALVTDDAAHHAFGVLQGTSFSAPVVTGLAARVLSANPALDAVQVRNVLIRSALADTFTGAVPNAFWGYGKAGLDVGSAPLPPDLRILADALPEGVVDRPYSFVFTASGGTVPYAWSVSAGSLPPGFVLEGGSVSGTPTAPGTYAFTVAVSDSSGPPQSDERSYQVTIAASPPFAIVTSRLPTARVGRPYDQRLEAEGGDPPYQWFVAGGALPPGLSLSGDRVQGTPTELGAFDLAIQVEDSGSRTALQSFRLRVSAPGPGAWDPLGIVSTAVNRVAIDPGAPGHLLASTHNTFDSSQDAVFESTDAGETWTALSINSGFSEVAASDAANFLAVGPATSAAWAVNENGPTRVLRYDGTSREWIGLAGCSTPGVVEFDEMGVANLLCASSKTFRRSTDEGATWQTVGTLCGGDILIGGGLSGSLSVSRSDPSRLYAVRQGLESGTFTYVCRSEDGGATWQEVGRANANDATYLDVRVSSVDPQDVVRTLQETSSQFLERSTNGGTTWSRSTITTAGFPCCLERSAADPSVLLYGSSAGLFRSTDHGQTWSPLPVQGATRTVTSLALDRQDAGRFLVGTTEGLFLTEDAGESWSLRSRGLVRQALTGLALSPLHPTELLLGTTSGEAFLSRTLGQRWTAAGTNLAAFGVKAPVISAADPDLYWIAGHDSAGVFRSDNRGLTWTLTLSGSTCTFCWSVGLMDADPFDPDNVLATVAGQEIYRSTDRGATWASVPNPGFADAADLTYARGTPGLVFGAWDWDGIFRSTDGGASWQPFGFNGTVQITKVKPAPSDSDYVYAASGSAVHYLDPAVGDWEQAAVSPARSVLAFGVDWTDPRVAYAGTSHPGTPGVSSGLYKTTDGGRTWTHLPGVLDAFNVVSVFPLPGAAASVVAATAEGGVYRSTDGGATWAALDRYGRVAEVVNQNLRDPSNPSRLFAATDGYGVQVSTNGGRSYVPRVAGLGNLYVRSLAFDPDAPGTLYAGTEAGIFKSTDSAGLWAPTALGAGTVTDIVTDNEGVAKRIWATVSGQGVAYSADGGATFAIYSTGLASLELTSVEIENLGSAKRIWATMRGGDGVAYSDDLGQTWVSAAGNGLTDRRVNDLAIDAVAKRIWATTDSGVFFTDDSGLTWTDLSSGLPGGVPVSSASIDPHTGEVLVSLFSEEEGGVYRGGSVTGVWSPFRAGLEELRVRRLTNDDGHVVDPFTNGTTFYAATAGDGVYASEVRTSSAAPPVITTSALPEAELRVAYAASLAASGGTPPYSWSVVDGDLPPGLRLDVASGAISGTPGLAGAYPVTVQVGDANARTARRSLALRVRTEEAPLPSLSLLDAAVVEGDHGAAPAVFTVSLSAPAVEPVTASYATSDGTARAGSDYVGASGTVTLAPGSSTATFAVSVRGDLFHEGDETFQVRLTQVTHASLADGEAIGTVVDDDPQPSISIANVTVGEGAAGRRAVFRLSLSAPAGVAVTVQYATSDGTARAGSDYSARSGMVRFPPQRRFVTLAVPVLDDAVPEGTETFLVDLGAPVNGTLARARGVGTILDDDARAPSRGRR